METMNEEKLEMRAEVTDEVLKKLKVVIPIDVLIPYKFCYKFKLDGLRFKASHRVGEHGYSYWVIKVKLGWKYWEATPKRIVKAYEKSLQE